MDQRRSADTATRRDFLAGVAAGGLAAGFPWLPRAALASGGAERAPAGAEISHVRIYPALGICRVGGSSEWFYAPEIPGLPAEPERSGADPGFFKDDDQLIKKQAQRFRVYAFDDQNRVIGELTDAQAEVSWQVHLANTKAAWYGFNNPQDNGELAPGLPGQRRNQFFVTPEQRQRMLIIDGGVRTIAGRSVNVAGADRTYAFEGRFWDAADVALGELRTDGAGRLIVLPPSGKSHSPTGAPITSFADNDAWYDDWCDGPVTAQVSLPDGRVLDAEPSWVACVGPNYAPEIPPVTTLHDVIVDLNHKQGWVPERSGPLSFRKAIYPTFRRVALMAWLSDSGNLQSGWLDTVDFADPELIERLADPGAANQAFRQSIFALFRDPGDLGDEAFITQRLKLPYMLGDGVDYDGSPLQWFQFPRLQYENLRAWADGDFVDDLDDPGADAITTIEDLPVEQQPAALTEAALEPCSGGAFHPGVELSYYMRLAPMYARHTDPASEPFRIAHGSRPSLLHDVGRLLSPDRIFEGGDAGQPSPIGPQMAGDLTRWMGLPWQCDAFSCQQVLLQDDFPVVVWWPALLPVDVLTEANYQLLLRSDLPSDERMKFFASRSGWSRGVAGIGYHANASYWDGITNMIALWQHMGFVVKRPGPTDPGRPEGIPAELFVETGRAASMEARFPWSLEQGVLPQ